MPVVEREQRTAFVEDREGAAVDEQEVDDGAAHADGRDRRSDRIIVRVLRAGDEAQCAAGQRDRDVAGILVRIVDVIVEAHFGTRPDAERGLVLERKRGATVVAGGNGIFLKIPPPAESGWEFVLPGVDLIGASGGETDRVGLRTRLPGGPGERAGRGGSAKSETRVFITLS